MDPIGYITKIKPIAEKAGICRIIPPSEWDKHSFFKTIDPKKFRFTTKSQSIHQMFLGKDGPNPQFLKKLKVFLRDIRHVNLNQLPVIDGQTVDLYHLFTLVESLGGINQVLYFVLYIHLIKY